MEPKENFILFLIVLFLTCLITDAIPTHQNNVKLVIDHDGGADDAMAIFISILYEKYFSGPEILAITTVFGNVNETQVYINTQRILDKAGRRDVPIYRGATRALLEVVESDYFFGKDGLGDQPYEKFKKINAKKLVAAFTLIKLSKIYEGSLIVMATGPMTNIALAKRLDPKFEGRLKQLYVGAGHVYSPKYPNPEFNAKMDVEAYHIVVDNSTTNKLTVVPFSQIINTLNISKEWRINVLGTIPTPIMQAQNSYETVSLAHSNCWCLLDPAVAAIMLNANVVEEYVMSNNSIHLCGKVRGINTNNFRSNSPNVRMVYAAKKDYYKQLLIDIFSAELHGPS